MTFIVLASILCALPVHRRATVPASQPSEQLSDEDIRQRIETYMNAIDTRIADADWRALGARGAAILERMAQDPTLFPTRRATAVAGLAAIGSSNSSSVLLTLAKSEQAPLNVRLAAVHGAPGVVPAAQVPTALKPVLEGARDGHVRAAAAEVLSRHGGCALVEAQARREGQPLRLQRALDRCKHR
jgi:HEAT repeat protein